MALTEPSALDLLQVYDMTHWCKKYFKDWSQSTFNQAASSPSIRPIKRLIAMFVNNCLIYIFDLVRKILQNKPYIIYMSSYYMLFVSSLTS